jgi:hypothetical protein
MWSLSSLFISCQGKKGTGGSGNEAVADVSGNQVSSGGGDAGFSVTIDGVHVSGKGTGELQLVNAAFIYPKTDSRPETILFDLYSTKAGDDFYSLRFSFPDKEGTYQIEQGNKNCACYIILDFNLRSSDNFARYDGQAVTVDLQKISSTRITGTFSGTFSLSADTRSKPYKKQVTITDGKFDIPFSTGNLRPM